MESDLSEKTTIAIIGGGVAGLGTAYELRRQFVLKNRPLQIDIFEEKALLGGNADTVSVNLGESVKDKKPYLRWADLGVNDINLSAYKRIGQVMKDIGFHNEDVLGGPQGLLPLENTDCYFSNQDDSKNIIDDTDLESGVTHTRYNLEHIEDGKLAKIYNLVFKAADTRAKEHPHDYDYTVGDFFEEIEKSLKTPAKNSKQSLLHIAAKALAMDIDCTDPLLADLIDQVRRLLFLPRIAAMYFTDDKGPEYLPLVSPMNYFNTQESKDKGVPKRRYFIAGSQAWIEALALNLTDSNPHQDLVSIKIHKNKKAKAKLNDHSFSVSLANETQPIDYDYGIVATHADHANGLLSFSDTQAATKKTIEEILGAIRYTESYGVCHTYPGVMPSNRNLWRSYNIDIREGEGPKPYNMSYLVNRHQNDTHQSNSRLNFNKAGLPQYFVTLLDNVTTVPYETILDLEENFLTELSAILPEQTPWSALALSSSQRGGYRHKLSDDFEKKYKNKAVTLFRHNVLDKNCLQAQDQLKKYHQNAGRLYITGGWSQGAGLHEECWQQAESIADKISSKSQADHTDKKQAKVVNIIAPATPA